jgi:hypothetical protein
MADHAQRLSFAPDVIVQTIDGEALILKLHDEEVFSLNQTGARVARLIADGERLDAVIDILSVEYGVGRNDVEREVRSLVHALVSRGLLIASPDRDDR